MGGVFCHIGSSTTVFTTQCQTLQHTQADQDDGSSHTNAGVGGQQAHDEGGQTHDQDGDQEGVFAANHVAQTPEHQCTKRPHDETGRKGQQREDDLGVGVEVREELFTNDRGQGAVQVKVVPLKNGA